MSTLEGTVSDIEENIKMDIGTEDELSDPSILSRMSQRRSAAGQITQVGHDPTPYANVSTFRSSHKIIAKKPCIPAAPSSRTDTKAINASETSS